MHAVWDFQLPRGTPAEGRRIVDHAADLGFDTLVTDGVTPAIADRAAERGLTVLDVVHPYPDPAFREAHPDALQRMLPVEERIAEVLVDERPDDYLRLAHRGYPIVHDRNAFCFAATAARERVESRVAAALELADGVAFDGFGFRNHYACFCDRCRDRRQSKSPAAVARDAEDVLVDLSEHLYEHAKDIDSDAVVANHVWPPFRPNPEYGRRLRLDYRSDTVAWFYPPHRSLDEVAFAIRRGCDIERSERNRFVPFVGVYPDPELTRSPARVADELRIAIEQCEDIMFATLEAAVERSALGGAVRSVLLE